MIKVITYGTYDLLHQGHIRLLQRAKALGDHLIVGVTADDFDKARGKINVKQSLMERIAAVSDTGIADEIIIEEYEGQKIDDIRRYDIDIFTVGSDWEGKFDYLNEYCNVVYLERTQGISSSEMREKKRSVRLGLVGDSLFLDKVKKESTFVNGIHVCALCTKRLKEMSKDLQQVDIITQDFNELLENEDAVYIRSLPEDHYDHVRKALEEGKHVLCESPLTLNERQSKELFDLAMDKKIILMEAIKTAYSTAYSRLLLLIKGGKIGRVVSVDATCTSLKIYGGKQRTDWDGIFEWGPTALLPIFQILGTDHREHKIVAHFDRDHGGFTKIDFIYDHAVASIKIGDGVKSEGEMVISGTDGYIYVPAPWWKTEYFEIRYEDPADNKRYFYQLDGEGIRYELVAFLRAIEHNKISSDIDKEITYKISDIMDDLVNSRNMVII